MIKIGLAIAGLAAAGWYFAIDGSKLDESMVREFYEKQQHAVLSRDPQALCNQFASNAVVTTETLMMGQTQAQTLNNKTACDATRKTFKSFEDMGEKAGGILTIEYEYKIDSIDIAANKKRATVVTSNILKMGESFMQFRTTATEELVRNYRVVQLAKSDSKTGVRWTPSALADPSKFFVER
jgi:hypothetical protein